jgi:Esterase PHB depolymerase
LNGLVFDFLETKDGVTADQRLADILTHPQATLATVESILKEGHGFARQPVGTQPGMAVSVRGRSFRYGLYVPPVYDPLKPYALVLCLHGAGFTGDSYLERWQTRLNDGYIVACPTLPQGNWWTRQGSDLVMATIEEVESRYHIDPDRVFLTGMSNGGIGAYLIGSHYAPVFAGVAPMAGGLDDVLLPFLQNLRHTPLYIIHGSKDDVMPVQLSRTITDELRRLGYAFVYREHDRTHPIAGGHYFPREELPDLVAWLAGQRRDPFPKRLTVVRDASHLVPFGWIRIDATDRIASFSDNLTDSRDPSIVNRVYAKVDAEIVGPNRIEVRTQRVKRYALFLNQSLVDLTKPVTVVTNGRISFSGNLEPNLETLLREARHRHDPAMLFPASLTVSVEGDS